MGPTQCQPACKPIVPLSSGDLQGCKWRNIRQYFEAQLKGVCCVQSLVLDTVTFGGPATCLTVLTALRELEARCCSFVAPIYDPMQHFGNRSGFAQDSTTVPFALAHLTSLTKLDVYDMEFAPSRGRPHIYSLDLGGLRHLQVLSPRPCRG